MQLRLRKSGGAGFTINPSETKRKRKRNKKKVSHKATRSKLLLTIDRAGQTPEERAAAAARAIANGAEPKNGEDGIAVVSGLTAMNAKQKRKQRQNENKAKGKDGAVDGDVSPADAKPAPKAAKKAGSAGKKVKSAGKPAAKKQKKVSA